jgi:hypothetical protein
MLMIVIVMSHFHPFPIAYPYYCYSPYACPQYPLTKPLFDSLHQHLPMALCIFASSSCTARHVPILASSFHALCEASRPWRCVFSYPSHSHPSYPAPTSTPLRLLPCKVGRRWRCVSLFSPFRPELGLHPPALQISQPSSYSTLAHILLLYTQTTSSSLIHSIFYLPTNAPTPLTVTSRSACTSTPKSVQTPRLTTLTQFQHEKKSCSPTASPSYPAPLALRSSVRLWGGMVWTAGSAPCRFWGTLRRMAGRGARAWRCGGWERG